MNSLNARLLRRRMQAEDRGATLILAIVIVATVAVVTGAILSHAWTNSAATITVRGVAGRSYAADAAAKLAINNLRLGSTAPGWVDPVFGGSWADPTGWVFTNNDDGAGCFGASGTAAAPVPTSALELDTTAAGGFYPRSGDQASDSSARVECAPVVGTGIRSGAGGVVISDGAGSDDPAATAPFARALTTIGTSGSHQGVHVQVLGSAAPIGGGVGSKTFVTADNGDLTSNGAVFAGGSCAPGNGGGQVVSPELHCNLGASGVATPDDPGSPLTSVPVLIDPSTVASCHFPAGSYISGQTLTAAVNACNTRARPAAYFDDTSGPYYFDFADGHPWRIDTEVIGGVPTGSLAIPGACKSAIDSVTPVAGVQFVFGGSSNVEVDSNAEVELCGPSNGGHAPITIYQQQIDGSSATTTPTPTSSPTTTTTSFSDTAGAVTTLGTVSNSRDSFVPNTGGAVPKANLENTGDAGATWISTTKGNTGELDLSNFAHSIPAGATVTDAAVHIALSGTRSNDVTPRVALSGLDLGTISGTTDLSLTAAQRSLLTTAAASSNLAPSIAITIPAVTSGPNKTPAQGSTVTVDQVILSVTYTISSAGPPPPPTVVKIERATDTVLFSSGSNFPGRFVVQGATYAPQGYIDMGPGNVCSSCDLALVAFRWGLIASGVNFKTQPQQLFGYPLVSIPVQGLGSRTTVVDLKVYVCVASATCASPNGIQSLTTRVMITDPPYDTSGTYDGAPEPGRRQIRILGWAEQR